MKELSVNEMTSLRGGSFNTGIVASLGNVGIAVPINIQVLSDNALFGSSVTDSHNQQAQNIVGNQWVNQMLL
jgi:hypothetical protein